MLVVRKSNAPLVFWCYCLQFVVDCLNHTSVKSLDWKTPISILLGNTPDISMFRFGFWSPVWYYEPTAKFPAPNFLPVMHIGIVSEHGDYFTYKVWTTPNNKWEDGQELIRDIVTMRDHADMSPRVSDLLYQKKLYFFWYRRSDI